MKAAPVSVGERIVELDIIRGFALFGILLVNMPAFNTPDFIRQMYYLSENLSPIDEGVRLLFNMFVQTKFYTIFSFLFGLGFYIFISRAQQRSDHPYLLFSLRLVILLLFGLLHLVFLWFGDILHTYALIGFLLLLFYKRSNKTILGWAFGLLMVFYALLTAQLMSESVAYIQQQQGIGTAILGEAVRMYQAAPSVEWLAYRLKTEVSEILSNSPFMIPVILPLFLFGLYAGKRRIFESIGQNLAFIKGLWHVSLWLSLPLTALVALLQFKVLSFGPRQTIATQLFISLNGFTLCFFYISSLVLLLQKEKWQKRLRPLGYVGRMALTNYLFQTILSLAIIFGFHLFNHVSLFMGLLLSLGIYGVQVAFSVYWLKKFNYGPFEWIWRCLTYGSIQPLRLQNKDNTY